LVSKKKTRRKKEEGKIKKNSHFWKVWYDYSLLLYYFHFLYFLNNGLILKVFSFGENNFG